ncbi:MAG: DUF2203 domain-containing protein [Phycisphaerales bacterium]|nr:DUF2203 domain-containing protein [Phycisphaerales bacterium]MCB9862397.1 DUF2203 domain-containing protein [Phycisphaerales bacterium]
MEAYEIATARPRFNPHSTGRIFTIEQANRALPLVSRVVSDIVQQQRDVCALEEMLQEMHSRDWDASQERYTMALERLRDLIDELSDVGCQLRDWRRGIVDFPAIHNDRRVELCWRLGERRICHWHEPEAGFRCRQPIDERFRQRAQ